MSQTSTMTAIRQRGALVSSSTTSKQETNAPLRAPTQKSPFTVGDLRRAIPAHCFQHSLVTSFAYLFLDVAMVFALFKLSQQIDKVFTPEVFGSFLSFLLQHVCWSAYWFAQGVVLTGLWVIGHECGHGGFAAQGIVNDVVGWTIHSLLLVPYFSWKISHRRHHSNTGNIDRDEVFVPAVGSKQEQLRLAQNLAQEDDDYFTQIKGFVQRVTKIVFMLTFGWMAYLWTNATSNKSYPGEKYVNHFFPSSPIFSGNERKLVLLSDIGMLLQIALLSYISYSHGAQFMLYTYFLPYMVNVAFLVLITFLQHTHKTLPHYDATEWDWLRGALATVDRDFGILNFFHHHIADTHVCHHLFSYLPHYHAQEATDALKAVLGPYYSRDDTPILKALYSSYKSCRLVAPDNDQKGVYWF